MEYIYAFPVQQSVVALVPNLSVLKMVVISFVITFIFAFTSWHLVEKKMLKNKNKFFYFENRFKSIKKLSTVFTREN